MTDLGKARPGPANLSDHFHYESYGEYTTEQLYRDEALLKALWDCRDHDPQVEPQAQVVLDDVAKAQGWKPESMKE